jgi:hypothetical protein
MRKQKGERALHAVCSLQTANSAVVGQFEHQAEKS